MPLLSQLQQFRGLFFALLSGVVWSVNALGVVLTVETVSPTVLCFAFFLCNIFAVPFINWSLNNSYTSVHMLTIFVSSLLDVILLLTAYASFAFINFGNASALIYSKTLFCGVLGWLILGERFSKLDLLLLVIHFGGVILVSQPEFLFGQQNLVDPTSNLIGCTLALTGALSSSLEFITLRYLVESQAFDTALLLFTKCVVGVPVVATLSFYIMPAHRYIRTLTELGYVAFTCFSGLLAYGLTVIALRTEDTKTVAALVSVEVVLSFVFQITFIGETTDWFSVSGAILILLVLLVYCGEGIYYQNR